MEKILSDLRVMPDTSGGSIQFVIADETAVEEQVP
jgi:hypothetical protein